MIRHTHLLLHSDTNKTMSVGNECEVIWTDSVIFKTPKLQEANSLT